jgi:hypothetical protein
MGIVRTSCASFRPAGCVAMRGNKRSALPFTGDAIHLRKSTPRRRRGEDHRATLPGESGLSSFIFGI